MFTNDFINYTLLFTTMALTLVIFLIFILTIDENLKS